MSIKNTEGRIIIKADKDGKNWHTFKSGEKLRLERDLDNLDKKYTSQVCGEVVCGDYVPRGGMILFHHNCIHDVNLILNHDEELPIGVQLYSLKEDECYLWKMPDEKEWKPLRGFATALRVFEPYNGSLQNVFPEKVKDILYITSGEFKNKVCHTLKACDFSIIFNNDEGREETILRCRHYENEEHEREELIAVSQYLTEKVKKGELLIGLTNKDCKKIN